MVLPLMTAEVNQDYFTVAKKKMNQGGWGNFFAATDQHFASIKNHPYQTGITLKYPQISIKTILILGCK